MFGMSASTWDITTTTAHLIIKFQMKTKGTRAKKKLVVPGTNWHVAITGLQHIVNLEQKTFYGLYLK